MVARCTIKLYVCGMNDLQHRKARLRKAFKASGLSNAELGRRIGVTGQAVSIWMSDKDSEPSRENLRRFAQATNTSVDWLLSGRDEPRKDNTGKYILPGDRGRFIPMLSIASAAARLDPDPDATLIHSFYPCGPRSYFIVLADDANAPAHPRGTVWIIDPDEPPRPGSLVIARCGDDERPVLGKLHIETSPAGRTTIVTPLNPDYPAARSDLESVETVGVLVFSQHAHKPIT